MSTVVRTHLLAEADQLDAQAAVDARSAKFSLDEAQRLLRRAEGSRQLAQDMRAAPSALGKDDDSPKVQRAA